jgi:bacterioferritin-associated ferredoxin
MYVCICHAVTEKEVLAAARRGVVRLADLRKELKVPGDCGRCAKHARDLIKGVAAHCSNDDRPTPAASTPTGLRTAELLSAGA